MMFTFRHFVVDDNRSSMKVGTDAVLLGAWAEGGPGCRRVADVGTGCGVVALMVAQRLPQADVIAYDIHGGSVADAADNFAASPWAPRLRAVEADVLALPVPSDPFDLIVSNPPYFTETLRSPAAVRAGARHEQGLGVASLIALAARWLAPGGSLALVAPTARSADIAYLLALHGLHPRRRLDVRQRDGRPLVRTLWQASRSPGTLAAAELTLVGPDGRRTSAHQSLTSEYYIR